MHKDGVRLGELLVMASVLSPAEVLDCLERALITQKLIGEVFLEQGLVSQELLDAALTLQHMAHESQITTAQAAEGLKRIHSGTGSLEDVAADLTAQSGGRQIDYQKLLTLARVITAEDVNAAIKIGLKNPDFLAKLMIMTGFMDDLAMQSSLRCFEMLSAGILNQDDAVVSLDYCLHYKRHSPVSFDDALKELGWQPSDPSVSEQAEGTDTVDDVADMADFADMEDDRAVTAGAGEAASATSAKRGDGKFTDTIAPEDTRARELASLVRENKSDGILEKTAKGELGNVVFDSYTRLAESYIESGTYAEAQVVYERILVLRLQELGTIHPQLVHDLRNLAAVLCTQEKYEQAEPFMRRAVQILEAVDNDSLSLADTLMFLANIYLRQAKFQECEPLLNQSLAIRLKHLGPDHVETADAMFDLARVYRKTDRADESELMYTKAKNILTKHHEQEQYI
jgi:tetratricopeptide (TPR) repeat protein